MCVLGGGGGGGAGGGVESGWGLATNHAYRISHGSALACKSFASLRIKIPQQARGPHGSVDGLLLACQSATESTAKDTHTHTQTATCHTCVCVCILSRV